MSINADEASKLIDQNRDNPKFKVVDVRTGLERSISHIPNSSHVPVSDIESRLAEFNKENTYLVYCRSGARSNSAATTLNAHGFNAINMAGGMNAWSGPTESFCEIY
jgi:rhodanese-related sulfurtransferase